MTFNSKATFILAQTYIAIASTLFISGYVLKDPMQNGFYLIYALTLPFLSTIIFIFFSYKAIKNKRIMFGVINLFNFATLVMLFYLRLMA